MSVAEEFFTRRQAQAVLRHGVVSRYLPVFTSMAGTGAAEVVLVDAYAGPGRYDDGSPGSPLLLVETARTTKLWSRTVRCVFCEPDLDNVAVLTSLLAKEAGADLAWEVLLGTAEQWAPTLVKEAGSAPMLTFLDPFGAGTPYDLLTKTFLGRLATVPTEVLFNINVEMVQRIGGLLAEEPLSLTTERTLSNLDQFFGDTWWREEFIQARTSLGAAAQAAQHVVEEFCRRVHDATGFKSFQVPIRRRLGHQPLFILTLFYRHPVAPWKFNDAASGANADWRLACVEADIDRDLAALPVEDSLFGDCVDTESVIREQRESAWKSQEAALECSWVAEIEQNLCHLLDARPQVDLVDNIREVYGATLGLAREKHVRRAWDALDDVHFAAPRPRSVKLEKAVITRA